MTNATADAMANGRVLTARELAKELRRRQACGTLAMYWARKAARDELRRKGFKVSNYTAAEITTLARTYLDAHRAELIAQAKEVIRTSPLFAQWS
jgi:hypothetical protein